MRRWRVEGNAGPNQSMQRFPTALFVLLAASSLVAQESVQVGDYVLGPRDLIEIRVFQDPTLDTTTRVTEEATISMRLLGMVDVKGLTVAQAADRIKAILEERYMTKADVSIRVLEFENQPISVLGAVNKAGRIPLSGNMTLLQAISAAGGLAATHGRSLFILRTARNGLTDQLEIDVNQLLVGDPTVNIPIAPNDVINVPVDDMISIYVLGEVMRQGIVQFKRSQDVTLLQALAGAGGLTDRASRRDIVIKRKIDGREELIKVDLKRIIEGRSPDLALFDNDTIVVKESFF